MVRIIIENFVRKNKNPNFTLDQNISILLIIHLVLTKLVGAIRGLPLSMLGVSKRGLILGKSISFFNVMNMELGRNVNVGRFSKLSALGSGKLILGDNVTIGDYSSIVISTTFSDIGKYIRIGDNVGIGEYAYIGGAGGTEIGKDTIVGQYFSIHPENHNFESTTELIRFQGVSRLGVIIGSNCWLGSKVTVLDGVTIGDNCIVAAGSVVTKSFDANTVIGGVPAKILKQRL